MTLERLGFLLIIQEIMEYLTHIAETICYDGCSMNKEYPMQ